MTITYEWTESLRLPDGHRVFRAGMGRRWAIADNSGDLPENTDDGILWLDLDRPIAAAGIATVPLKDEAGKQSVFVTDVRTMLLLSDKFAWAIEAKDALYVVQAIK